MKKKNFHQVPVDIETQALLQALHDGRLFIQPASVSANDTRAEVISIITRIAGFASDENVVIKVWQELLADDDRLPSFHLRKRQTAWQSDSEATPINYYRILAIIRYMCGLGLYDMQKCKSANVPCTFRGLCQYLFPDMDEGEVELYRRGCTNYAYVEDECIICQFINSTGESGNPININAYE